MCSRGVIVNLTGLQADHFTAIDPNGLQEDCLKVVNVGCRVAGLQGYHWTLMGCKGAV